MWALPKMVSFQMWKHHWRTSFKKYPAEQQYICMEDQHQTFENTL